MSCFRCKHGQTICDGICPIDMTRGRCPDCEDLEPITSAPLKIETERAKEKLNAKATRRG